MLNIVIPIAGRGSRFREAGYKLPKPIIPVHGKPMLEIVVDNVRPSTPHQFIFLVLAEHLEAFATRGLLERIAPGCRVIPVSEVTEGAACTVLLAKSLIDNDAPLMIANSDQWVDWDINEYLATMDREEASGLIMTMWSDHPKWSYVGFDENGRVDRTAEKDVISNEATVGIYNFRYGRDFVWAAEQMVLKNLRVNNEFYVCPVYNEIIAAGAKVVVCNVGREGDGMYGMGIPRDLELFEANPVSRRAAGIE